MTWKFALDLFIFLLELLIGYRMVILCESWWENYAVLLAGTTLITLALLATNDLSLFISIFLAMIMMVTTMELAKLR